MQLFFEFGKDRKSTFTMCVKGLQKHLRSAVRLIRPERIKVWSGINMACINMAYLRVYVTFVT